MRVLILTLSHPTSRTNRQFREEFEARGVDVLFCQPNRLAVTVGANPVLTYDGKSLARPDFVLTRTGAGAHTANIIRHFESTGIDVANRIVPIQTAIDKAQTMLAAAAADLPIPKTMIVSTKDGNVAEWTEFPCIVKLPIGSCGNGVILVDTSSRLKAIFDMVKTIDLRGTQLLVQEYLGDQPGVDLRVIVIGKRAIGAMQRTAKKGENRANLAQGAGGKAVELTPKIAEISERITQILDLDFAGVDLLFKGDHYAICEVNSSPGMKFATICDINVVGKIADYVVGRLNLRLMLKAN